MESLPNNLTTVHPDTIIATSSPDTSGKTIMSTEKQTTDDIVAHNREWAIDRVESAELVGEKIALYAEFEEWIELEEEGELEIFSIEDDDNVNGKMQGL